MTATRIKLTQPGESLTMMVLSCAKATQGRYPGVEFIGDDGSANQILIEVPEATTERQLKRLGLTERSIVGKVVTFSRDPNPNNPSAPYWGLSAPAYGQPAAVVPALCHAPAPPNGSSSVPAPARAQETAPEQALTDQSQIKLGLQFVIYDKCMAHALKVAERTRELGFDVDPAQIAACLYKQANR